MKVTPSLSSVLEKSSKLYREGNILPVYEITEGALKGTKVYMSKALLPVWLKLIGLLPSMEEILLAMEQLDIKIVAYKPNPNLTNVPDITFQYKALLRAVTACNDEYEKMYAAAAAAEAAALAEEDAAKGQDATASDAEDTDIMSDDNVDGAGDTEMGEVELSGDDEMAGGAEETETNVVNNEQDINNQSAKRQRTEGTVANVGNDTTPNPRGNGNGEHETPAKDTDEILGIHDIVVKVNTSLTQFGVKKVLKTHFTPQAQKWDTEGKLADHFKLVEQSANQIKLYATQTKVVKGVGLFKEELAPFFPKLNEGDEDEQEDLQD